MSSRTKTWWGIHAGKTGDAHHLFLTEQVVGIGWPQMGDLSSLSPNREAFKERAASVYPGKKPGAIPNIAGQMFRFVHEMAVGDFVAYPSKHDRKIYLGRVKGSYAFRIGHNQPYPHQRDVDWLKEVPRTQFSQGALYELGSAMSLFQIKNYVDEFFAALEGQPPIPTEADDETAGLVADEIEETTRDFVIKKLARELKGHPFAEFVAHLLSVMGYRSRVSSPGPDKGVDILAHRDELGFEPPIIKVQVKSSEGSVGDPEVSALYGKVTGGEFGLLVSLGTFTNPAKAFADTKSNLRLIDGEELVELIFQHYEHLDSRYKGLIPLRRVYVPEAIEEED